MLFGCATDADALPQRGLGGVRTESFLRDVQREPAPVGEVGGPSVPERTEPPVVLLPAPEPEPPAGTPVRASEDAQRERMLREALASDVEPSEAALDLAALLCSLERHPEALAVLDAALPRSKSPLLRVARASVLRDLGRRDQAAAELRNLAAAHGTAELHPGLIFEWAELEWIAGNPEGAKAALLELAKVHPKDPWCTENRATIEDLSRAIESRQPPSLAPRDLLGELRGAQSVAQRIRVLEILTTIANKDDPDGRTVRTQAVAIACGDESPAIRARGVQLAAPGAEGREAFFTKALADEAAIVRRIAAERAAVVMGDAACPLLVARMASEDDAAVFLQLHESLAGLVAGAPQLPAEGLEQPEARLLLAAEWRKRCSR